MIETDKRITFFRSIHLFHDLNEDELTQIVESFTELQYEAGQMILEQGSAADSFYIIYSGKVRVFREYKGETQELAELISHDFFGEMEISSKRGVRSASISALEPTLVLQVASQEFSQMLETYPAMKPNIKISIESRKLARKLHFKWLRQDEVVYFAARKHVFFLFQTLIPPMLLLLVSIVPLVWGLLVPSSLFQAIAGISFVVNILWAIWKAVDWGNDYYVVTNQRVVWLEKIIGLYDSRTEVSITDVKSVNVDTDYWGQIFNYGNVIVRTWVGTITFRHVLLPYQAATMVNEYWKRTHKTFMEAESENFRNALRQRLGLIEPQKEEQKSKKTEKASKKKKPSLFFNPVGTNAFKLRIEEGATVTYRKHWFVLLRQVFFPSGIFLISLGLMISRLYILYKSPDTGVLRVTTNGGYAIDTLIVVFLLLLLFTALWWLYQYIDWSNDIFRVTKDQIMDLDRKPFGTVERRVAPLENILGIHYERIGILGYFLNFGTVHIDVGSEKFAFEDVLDPAGVQSDVNRRRLAQEAEKRKSEQDAERNRMADWIAVYHENVEKIRQEQESKNTDLKNE